MKQTEGLYKQGLLEHTRTYYIILNEYHYVKEITILWKKLSDNRLDRQISFALFIYENTLNGTNPLYHKSKREKLVGVTGLVGFY